MIFPAATAGVLIDLDHRMAKDLAVTYFVEDEGASRRRSRRTTEEQQEQEQEQPQDFGRDESSDGEVVVGASGKAMRVIGAKDGENAHQSSSSSSSGGGGGCGGIGSSISCGGGGDRDSDDGAVLLLPPQQSSSSERSRSGSRSGSRRRRRLLAPTTYGADVSFVVAASAAALGLGGPADFTQAYSEALSEALASGSLRDDVSSGASIKKKNKNCDSPSVYVSV